MRIYHSFLDIGAIKKIEKKHLLCVNCNLNSYLFKYVLAGDVVFQASKYRERNPRILRLHWRFLQAMDKTCADIIEKKTFTDAYKCCMSVQSVVAFKRQPKIRPGDWQIPCGIKPKIVSSVP